MAGKLILDDGAVQAIVNNGKSLLSVGVVEIQGDFDNGDVVECVNSQGVRVAVGQVSYSAREANQFFIERHKQNPVIIHRDNMAIVM